MSAATHRLGTGERAVDRAMDGLFDAFTYLVMNGGRERHLSWSGVRGELQGAWRAASGRTARAGSSGR